MQAAKNIILYFVFLLCALLLFIGGPNSATSRSVNHIWDLGHIILFALGSFILIHDLKIINRCNFFNQLLIIFGLSLVLGIVSEYFQIKFNRTPDITDLWRDIIGGLFAVVFSSPGRKNISKLKLYIVQAIVLILFIYQLIPLSRALTDEMIARYQFPVLSNFETPFEIDRWTPPSQISISRRVAIEGSRSLQIKLTTSHYSGVFLKYFPPNWKNYTSLLVSVFNPDTSDLRLVCRIEDRWHEMFNLDFNDRYNQRFMLTSGWNALRIPINDLINAPKLRKMDIKNITQIGFFSVRLPESRVIYIDNLLLQ